MGPFPLRPSGLHNASVMQTCRRLPLRPLNTKQNRGRARAAPVRSLNFSTPSRRPHRPRSTTRTASRRPDEASGLSSCRARERHHFRSREARDLQSCLPPHRDLQGSGGAYPGLRQDAPPSQLMRGRSRARPRSPCPWGSGLSPALVALACALLRACALPGGPPWSAVLHTARSLFSPTLAPVRPVARPHRDGGARRRSAPWPCPTAEEIKTKAKRGMGLGWWWRRV